MSQTVPSTVLSVRGARKTFDQTVALDGVDLSLERGEWLGLLGPNGAGKTTLVRSIAGHVRLGEGRVELLGRPIQESSRKGNRRELGIVPQEIALYALLTAEENLQIFGRLHGVEPEDLPERIAWALDWSGLREHAGELTKTFSGGMKRRLNIACAILHRPEVLLLDEPTAGVDPQSRQRIWDMLAERRREGASILLTTHQLDEAQQVCDRIVIIDHGQVIAEGTMTELITGTVGAGRRVIFELDRAVEAEELPASWCRGAPGRQLAVPVDDPIEDLPAILQRIGGAGYRVKDLRIENPTLHDVFLHLTGRGLRQ